MQRNKPSSKYSNTQIKTQIQHNARHQPEDTSHLLRNIVFTTTCPNARQNREGSASTIGTLDLDVEKKGAIERHIAGKWHIFSLKEAKEYLEHDFLTNRYLVTHYGGCAILFNKDTTFFSDTFARHQGLRTGQDKRMRIWMGVTRCHFKSIFPSAAAQRPKDLHGHVSAH